MNTKRITPLLMRLSARSRGTNYTNVCRINLQSGLNFASTTKISVKKPPLIEIKSNAIVPDNNVPAETVQKDISEETAILKLRQCGNNSDIRCLNTRRQLQQKVWDDIQKNKELSSINLFNAYVQACIENELSIDYKAFLEQAKPYQPNQETYLKLLQLYSKLGDVNEAVDILTEMKLQGLAVDENVFNALIIGYTFHKGLEGANYVLGTMKLTKVPITTKTNWAILDGLVSYGNRNEFRQFLEIIPKLTQQDKEYMDLLYAMGARGHHLWLEDILGDFDWDAKDRTFMNAVHEMCLQLINRHQADAAVHFYTTFVEPIPNEPYGQNLLSEMLDCKIPIQTAIDAARRLQGKNAFALFDLTFMTLQKQMIPDCYLAMRYLPFVRPHFFWPVLQSEGKQKGEFGILHVLKKMNEFNVKPDYSTFEDYVFKYYNLNDPLSVMQSVTQIPNIMQRDALSPLVSQLLRDKRIDDAKLLCVNSNKIPLNGDRIMTNLVSAWEFTHNESVVPLLQKICETNSPSTDWVGIFLNRCLRTCRNANDIAKFACLVHALEKNQLKITSTFYDYMMQSIGSDEHLTKFKGDLEALLEKLMDITKQAVAYIAHPKDMNVEELENHLVELESKNMETRGILRKLIMAHAKLGHHDRVQELRLYAKSRNYEETAGMKSALFHSLVLSGDLTFAQNVYKEIKVTYPSFKIDTFKIIDYSTLLVRNGVVDEAISVISKEAKPMKVDKGMVRNCWNLLGSAQRPEDAFKLFQLLVERNYCKPTNVILGPMLRPFVKPETVDKLVTNFCNCATEYRATPLQLEVLCVVLETKDEKLLQKVINAIASVHGAGGARMGLISALAEMGLEKPILKLLSEKSQLRLSDLTTRVQRWVNEGKILPLKTLEAANKRLSISAFDNALTSSAIMKIHCNRQDIQSALSYWNELEENEGRINKQCATELVDLLKKHNFNVPSTLQNITV